MDHLHGIDQGRGRTLQLCDEIRQQGLQLNVITYSAVVCACGKCRMPVRALQLFNEMQQQGLQPNAIPYTAVVSASLPNAITVVR